MESLFVYGTSGPGRPNAHLLENMGGSTQKGRSEPYLLTHWGASTSASGCEFHCSMQRYP